MSVEPSELASEVWTRWQGHVINGVFTLGRYLGGSDHSGVFLTRSAARPSEVAIKLVPTNRALAESLLPRWKRAGSLVHPHLLRLFEWGGCQLDGLPYLYAVMEYADQTLAQLLLHRALTEDEAREMLLPTLDALAFLHGRNLLQGQLKPANILVVGDQLKLASDTIRRVSDGAMSNNAPTLYDPPEARYGNSSTAGDVWALGVSLFEALTRRPLPSLGEPSEAAALPADFSPVFGDVVARCLSHDPRARPSVSELIAWADGRSTGPVPAATIEPVTVVLPPEPSTAETTTAEPTNAEPTTPEPTTPEVTTAETTTAETTTAETTTAEPTTPEPVTAEPVSAGPTPPHAALPPTASPPTASPPTASPPTASPPTAPAAARPQPSGSQTPRAWLTMMLVAAVVLAIGWSGLRMLTAHSTQVPPRPPVETSAGSASPTEADGTKTAGVVQRPASAVSTAKPGRGDVATSPSALHEVTPDVPWGARRTIRGHIRVWVRVIVNEDGSVFAAVADRSGPSSYFERLSIEAAKKWTFPPVDTPSQRMMQVRFDFTRDGATGHAVKLH